MPLWVQSVRVFGSGACLKIGELRPNCLNLLVLLMDPYGTSQADDEGGAGDIWRQTSLQRKKFDPCWPTRSTTSKPTRKRYHLSAFWSPQEDAQKMHEQSGKSDLDDPFKELDKKWLGCHLVLWGNLRELPHGPDKRRSILGPFLSENLFSTRLRCHILHIIVAYSCYNFHTCSCPNVRDWRLRFYGRDVII